MKKVLSLVLSLCLICCIFAGCSKAPTDEVTESTTITEKAEITVIIDGNTFTEEFSEEDFFASLNSIDGLFYTKNEETNQYTLKMTSSAYTKLKEIKAKDVYTEFDRLKNDTENYIDDITYDEDFRNVKIIADTQKIPENTMFILDDNVAMLLGAAMLYQSYTVEGQKVNLSIVSSDDNKVIFESTFPNVIE